MALSQQQIQEMDNITGLTGSNIQKNRVTELQSLRQKVIQNKPEKESFGERVAGFTGGKQLAQGLGQAIANPKIAREQEQLLNDAIKQQGELLKRKKEIEELGGDTTAIDRGLAYNKQSLDELGGGLEQLLNQKDLTGKEVIGSALQLVTTIAGAGTVGKGISTVSKATTAGKGALTGLKAGATSGAIYGGASGVASGLEEDKNALEIAQKGIGGAIGGAALGGTLGAVTGGITGKIKGKAVTQAIKKEEGILNLVQPKATVEEKILAQQQGRVSKAGLLKTSKITPSKRDIQLAEAVKDVVNPKLNPQDNINLLNNKISDINTGVKAYVKINKTPFNTNQLTSQLNKGKDDLNLIFASDKQAEKTYNAVVKEFIKNVKDKDTSGLLDARQTFDKIPAIKKLLESQGLGENTKRQVVLTVRDMANKYISDLLPKGNEFRDALLKESKMIETIGNIADKNVDRIGRNTIQYLVKEYPWLKAAGWTALALSGLGAGIGVIGSATGGSSQ